MVVATITRLVPLIAWRVGITTRRDGVFVADPTMTIVNDNLASSSAPNLTLRGHFGIGLGAMVRSWIRVIRLFDVPAPIRIRNNMAVWHCDTLRAPYQALE